MKNLKKIILPIIGLISLIWFLIRVIPKPSRAYYPCQRAAFPLASAFVIWIIGTTATVFSFKRAKIMFQQSNIKVGILLLVVSLTTLISSFYFTPKQTANAAEADGSDTLFVPIEGVNNPIGEAKGIFPGRVVWVHNPNATNENCTNSNQSDAYFQDKNTSQYLVDDMLSEGILNLTGKNTHAEAWDAIFKHYNSNHDKGDVGYVDGETIFIKVNAVTAWSGAMPDGNMTSRIPVEFDTSPQAILALLRQLINDAGVPQQNIYIGDPIADLWNTIVDKCSVEFPDVNYVSKRDVPNRYKLTKSTEDVIQFSDNDTVLIDLFGEEKNLFQEMMNADYLLNIPTMKGHRWAGTTFFAKNHFGSNTSDGSWKLHKGLMNPDNAGMRYGYKKYYRVLTDLMASKYLGGKTLLFFMDGLWATSYEHQKPQKFQTAPFNDDWSSSIVLSLDPVAIESVCLDLLQKEFNEKDLSTNPPRYTYVQWDGVDDHLHQAADSSWWPDGITYDPEDDGIPISSLGVHEHWNNPDDMQYSRNLGTGDGIELVYKFLTTEDNETTFINKTKLQSNINVYPNPFSDIITLQNLTISGNVTIEIYDLFGREVKVVTNFQLETGNNTIDMSELQTNIYILKITDKNNKVLFSKSLMKL